MDNKTELKSNWARDILSDMIKTDFEKWKIEELPFDIKDHIRSFIISRKEENYEIE